MEYATSKEISKLWGIGQCRIIRLAREGRIPGSVQFGKSWMIPKDAEKPADGRLKQTRKSKEKAAFRFPLFVNASEGSYVPLLSKEETLLRTAQVDFFACRFEEAVKGFSVLSESAENIYVRICAVTFMAVLSSCYRNDINWSRYYNRLNLLLAEDFPHKEEMQVFLPWLDSFCGLYDSIEGHYHFNPQYEYHPSVNYLNSFLSIFLLNSLNRADRNSPAVLTQYEILCRVMEHDKHYYEAQALHRILFISYYKSQEENMALWHLKRVLYLAKEHDLLYHAADLASVYSEVFQTITEEYPKELVQCIYQSGEEIRRNFAEFNVESSKTNLYCSLSEGDYQLIRNVLQGYSYNKIAGIVHLSQRTVTTRLSKVYEKLGIKSREELIALFGDSRT